MSEEAIHCGQREWVCFHQEDRPDQMGLIVARWECWHSACEFSNFSRKTRNWESSFFSLLVKKKSNVFKKLRLSYWDSQFFIICKKKKIIKCFLKQIMQIWSYSCLKNYHFVTPDWAILIPPERHWRGDFIFFLLVCSLACFKCKNFGAPILASFALHSSPYHKFLPAPSSA